MSNFIRSFGFAIDGLVDAISQEQNFRFQWLMGLMVLLSINIIPFHYWQETILLILVFLVLSLELLNCGIEKACDSTGKHLNHDKKRAKDFAAAGVLLFSIASALIFLVFFYEHLMQIFASISVYPAAWIAMVVLFILSIPVCLNKSFNSIYVIAFLIGVLLDGFYMMVRFEKPLYLALASIFHGILTVGIIRNTRGFKP